MRVAADKKAAAPLQRRSLIIACRVRIKRWFFLTKKNLLFLLFFAAMAKSNNEQTVCIKTNQR